jgi:hypothetical protein
MVNLGFFREHRMSLPFPKKPLKLCPLQKMAERESSDVQRKLKVKERDFPAGLAEGVVLGQFRTYG